MKVTLSVIKADIGGWVGHSDSHPEILELAHQHLEKAKSIGPRDMFIDKGFDQARRKANMAAEYMRGHGPFEPHRLPLDEMEYTTMPQIMDKLKERFQKLEE